MQYDPPCDTTDVSTPISSPLRSFSLISSLFLSSCLFSSLHSSLSIFLILSPLTDTDIGRDTDVQLYHSHHSHAQQIDLLRTTLYFHPSMHPSSFLVPLILSPVVFSFFPYFIFPVIPVSAISAERRSIPPSQQPPSHLSTPYTNYHIVHTSTCTVWVVQPGGDDRGPPCCSYSPPKPPTSLF